MKQATYIIAAAMKQSNSALPSKAEIARAAKEWRGLPGYRRAKKQAQSLMALDKAISDALDAGFYPGIRRDIRRKAGWGDTPAFHGAFNRLTAGRGMPGWSYFYTKLWQSA